MGWDGLDLMTEQPLIVRTGHEDGKESWDECVKAGLVEVFPKR